LADSIDHTVALRAGNADSVGDGAARVGLKRSARIGDEELDVGFELGQQCGIGGNEAEAGGQLAICGSGRHAVAVLESVVGYAGETAVVGSCLAAVGDGDDLAEDGNEQEAHKGCLHLFIIILVTVTS
jgi:hypothetical protein